MPRRSEAPVDLAQLTVDLRNMMDDSISERTKKHYAGHLKNGREFLQKLLPTLWGHPEYPEYEAALTRMTSKSSEVIALYLAHKCAGDVPSEDSAELGITNKAGLATAYQFRSAMAFYYKTKCQAVSKSSKTLARVF